MPMKIEKSILKFPGLPPGLNTTAVKMTSIARAVMTFLSMFYTCIYMQPVFAEGSHETVERQVKSAYIFKFGNYITWPDTAFSDPSSPIIIGVIDDALVAEFLENFAASQFIGNRPVIVKTVNEDNINEGVHMLYIAHHAKSFLATYRNANPLSSTVYITDQVNGLATGSTINFVWDHYRLRFDISLLALDQSKIKLDASLLTVARQVIK